MLRLLTFTLFVAAWTGCAPERAGGAARTVVGPVPPPLDGLERLVHAEANGLRRRERRQRLRWSDPLARVARGHSEDMAQRGYFAHQSPDGATPQDRADAVGVSCWRAVGEGVVRAGVAENLYKTTRYAEITLSHMETVKTRTIEWYTADLIAETTVQGWRDSPAHRENLLDRHVEAHGIGVALGRDSVVYVTQVLC